MMRIHASRWLPGILLLLLSGQAAADVLCVSPEMANVREGPGTRHAVAWEAERYTPLEVHEWDGPWAKVTDVDGYDGWAHESVLSSEPCAVVAGKRANVRSGPGLEHEALWEVENGFLFQVLAAEGGWIQVTDGAEVEGWIVERLVWGRVQAGDPGGV